MYRPIQPIRTIRTIRTIHTTVLSDSYAPTIRINDTALFSNDMIHTILTTMGRTEQNTNEEINAYDIYVIIKVSSVLHV